MRGLTIIGLAMLLVAGGCSRKVTSTDTTTTRKDSTYVRYVPVKERITLPGAKAIVVARVALDSLGRFVPMRWRSREAEAFVDVKLQADGTLIARGGFDSLSRQIERLQKEVYRLTSEQTRKTKTVTQTKYKTRGIDIFCRAFVAVAMSVLALYLFLKFKNLIR